MKTMNTPTLGSKFANLSHAIERAATDVSYPVTCSQTGRICLIPLFESLQAAGHDQETGLRPTAPSICATCHPTI